MVESPPLRAQGGLGTQAVGQPFLLRPIQSRSWGCAPRARACPLRGLPPPPGTQYSPPRPARVYPQPQPPCEDQRALGCPGPPGQPFQHR